MHPHDRALKRRAEFVDSAWDALEEEHTSYDFLAIADRIDQLRSEDNEW